jgi:hypothetical protein
VLTLWTAGPHDHQVIPLTSAGAWIADTRGEGRGVRVSAHTEAGFLVVSTWKADICVGTVRLLPDEAAELVAGLCQGLAQLAQPAQLAPLARPR